MTGRGKRKLHLGADGWGRVGGYMNAKLEKLEDQFEKEKKKADQERTRKSSIFQGVSVFVNGYTQPTSAEIKTLMAEHGGQYCYYYTRTKVTHTIANNLPFTKIRKLKQSQKVVHPTWITDRVMKRFLRHLRSIAAGVLLPCLPYEMYANNRGQQNIDLRAPVNEHVPVQASVHDELRAPLNKHVATADLAQNDSRDISSSKCQVTIGTLSSEPDTSLHQTHVNEQSVTNKYITDIYPNNSDNCACINRSDFNLRDSLTNNDGDEELFIDVSQKPRCSKMATNNSSIETISRLNVAPSAFSDVGNSQSSLTGQKLPVVVICADKLSPEVCAKTPFRHLTLDLKTPSSAFHPHTSSTPLLSEIGTTNNSQSAEAAAAWLAESESPCSSQSQENNALSRSSREPAQSALSCTLPAGRRVERKESLESKQSNCSRDLFDTSADEAVSKRGNTESDRGSIGESSDSSLQTPKRSVLAGTKRRLKMILSPQKRRRYAEKSPDSLSDSSSNGQPELRREEETISSRSSDSSMPTLESCVELQSIDAPSEPEINESKSARPHTEVEKTNCLLTDNLHKTVFTKSLQAGDPNFISEFYSNSRLHHLSTWGVECKDYVNMLKSNGDTSFPGRRRLAEHLGLDQSEATSRVMKETDQLARVVMHVDMDCFFVSVGLRNRPDLHCKPVAVTHAKGGGASTRREGQDPEAEKELWMKRKMGRSRLKTPAATISKQTVAVGTSTSGDLTHQKRRSDVISSMAEIASCSYEARKAGVKNGMFLGQALDRCPNLQTISYDFEGYNEVSRQLYDTVASFTHFIEAVSCDEMYIDCTEVVQSVGCSPVQLAQYLRTEIYQATRCTASAGIGSNILLARLATRAAKPDNVYHVVPGDVQEFIAKQNIKDLPGVGWSTMQRLSGLALDTCADLQKMSLPALVKELGPKTGQILYNYCRGVDDRLVRSEKLRKSVSAEINYGIRFTKMEEVYDFVRQLAEEVTARLNKAAVKGKAVCLKLKVRSSDAPKETAKFLGHGVCDSICKSASLVLATDKCDVIARECLTIMRQIRFDPSDLRGMGIQIGKLVPVRVDASKRQNTLNFTASKKRCDNDIAFSMDNRTGALAKTTRATSELTSPVSDDVKAKRTSPDKGSRQKTPETKRRKDAEQFLISPSQVDPSVLIELPEYLQRQIRSAMKRAKTVGKDAAVDYSQTNDGVEKSEVKGREKHLISKSTNSVDSMYSGQRNEKSQVKGREQVNDKSTVIVDSSRKDDDVDTSEVKGREKQINGKSIDVTNNSHSGERVEVPEVKGHETMVNSKSTVNTMVCGSKISAVDDQVPGCSHWPDDRPGRAAIGPTWSRDMQSSPQINEDDVTNDDVVNVDTEAVAWTNDGESELPSFSQVDKDCLAALPLAIQQELMQAYEREKQRKGDASTSPRKLVSLSWKPGADGKTSPSKSPRKPSPKKLSPRKHSPSKSPKKSSPSKFKVPTRRPIAKRKRKSPKKSEPSHAQPLRPVQPASRVLERLSDDVSQSERVVKLCDAVSLQDVKSLVNAWMTSCEVPEPEDVDKFNVYMEELVLDRNLEQVFLLIKYIQRRMKQLPQRHQWESATSEVIDRVQACVVRQYGAPLKLST